MGLLFYILWRYSLSNQLFIMRWRHEQNSVTFFLVQNNSVSENIVGNSRRNMRSGREENIVFLWIVEAQLTLFFFNHSWIQENWKNEMKWVFLHSLGQPMSCHWCSSDIPLSLLILNSIPSMYHLRVSNSLLKVRGSRLSLLLTCSDFVITSTRLQSIVNLRIFFFWRIIVNLWEQNTRKRNSETMVLHQHSRRISDIICRR